MNIFLLCFISVVITTLVIGLLSYIYVSRINYQYVNVDNNLDQLTSQIDMLSKKILDYQKENKYLKDVIKADENIFDLLRCLNIPSTPSCKNINNTDAKYESVGICRSRQIDCNKFKLFLEKDPIAKERIKIATDKFQETDEVKNLSDLTYPVKSGWIF